LRPPVSLASTSQPRSLLGVVSVQPAVVLVDGGSLFGVLAGVGVGGIASRGTVVGRWLDQAEPLPGVHAVLARADPDEPALVEPLAQRSLIQRGLAGSHAPGLEGGIDLALRCSDSAARAQRPNVDAPVAEEV